MESEGIERTSWGPSYGSTYSGLTGHWLPDFPMANLCIHDDAELSGFRQGRSRVSGSGASSSRSRARDMEQVEDDDEEEEET